MTVPATTPHICAGCCRTHPNGTSRPPALLHHRNVLLREIDRERTAATTPATPAPQRRWLRPVFLLPATAVALAAL